MDLHRVTLLMVAAPALFAQGGRPIHPVSLTGVFVPVGGASPFALGCNGSQPATSTNYRNSAVEPFVVSDPARPAHLLAMWQQDRWTDGGASGLMASVSFDAGRTWNNSYAAFSLCTNGPYQRVSDPWPAIAPDGTAYQIALALDGMTAAGPSVTAVLVSKSTDGGMTWGSPATLVRHNAPIDDKEMIVADPNDSHYVYAVWDRSTGPSIATWFSRTTDGGATWEPAHIIYDPGQNGDAVYHVMAVLPDGSLVDAFCLANVPNGSNEKVAVLRSLDHGATWSGAIIVSGDLSIGATDLKTNTPVRSGQAVPSIAADPRSGTVYLVWPDSRFSNGRRDGIALSKSMDGGVTWSTPVQVNQAPGVQAFTPAVAVDSTGRVGVTYFDFRKDGSDPTATLAANWRIVSADGGATWFETPVGVPFNIRTAPLVSGEEFIGDYQGVTAVGDRFLSFYPVAGTGGANTAGVFAESLERPGDTRTTNLRTEINTSPRAIMTDHKPQKK